MTLTDSNGSVTTDGSDETRLARLNRRSPGTLPGWLGITIVEARDGVIRGEMEIRPELLAPNTYLHAGTVVSFADTLAGYGCWDNLPDGASGFTTVELKSNFLGTSRSGWLTCTATLRHGGRSTQIWDAEVVSDQGRTIALFRCTQMILYPRAG